MLVEGKLLINGRLCDAASGQHFLSIDPANQKTIGQCANAGRADMQRAIAAARHCFDESEWSRDHLFRAKCLRQLKLALDENKNAYLDLVIAEVGTTRGLAMGPQCWGAIDMIDWTIDYLEQFNWQRDIGEREAMGSLSRRFVCKEAIGVVAAITPWNFPVQITLAKLIPALAAGCTVVLKPAPDTPLVASFLGKLIAENTDIPAGAVNIVTSNDPAELGEMLSTDQRVDMISFTGSTGVGRRIMENSAATIKKVFLELGGKSANIILDDADLNTALLSALAVCFHAGQGCAIPTRLLVPETRKLEVEQLLIQYFSMVQYGDANSAEQIMGPLISLKQQQRVLEYIEIGKREGARVLFGGGIPDGLSDGFYIEPTVFTDVTNDMRIVREEIFGPVLCLLTFTDDADAIRIANDSPYGLSAAVSSADPERAINVASRLRTGTVNINGGVFLGPDAPFGGYKQSGIGREMGAEGFEEYLETKTLAIGVSQ